MNFVADLGNSYLKIAKEHNGKLTKITRFKFDDIKSLKKWLLNVCGHQKYNLFYTSVLDDNFTKKVLSNMNKHLSSIKEFKSSKSILSVTSAYKKPSKLGSDRWAQIITANKIFKKDCIIISCGSAISVDCVTSGGSHKGGLIFSGAGNYINCFSDIHNLKSLKLTKVKKGGLLQNSTKLQISNGYKIMISSAVDEVYSSFKKAAKRCPKVIVSGAYAKELAVDLKCRSHVEPYFVLKSLAYLIDKI